MLGVAALAALLIATPALAAAPLVQSASFSHVSETAVTLEATIAPNGVKVPTYRFQYVTLAKYEESGFTGAQETPNGPPILSGAGPTPFSAEISNLSPATAYRFRVFAENSLHEKTESPPVSFTTYAVALQGLPDDRAYEQASPLNKDGSDLTGTPSFVKAAASGNAISFGATSGIPGGVGAQQLPYYLATRMGEGAGASWLTQGLLPPADSGGQNAGLIGWTTDFSRVYQKAVHFDPSETAALLESRPGGATTEVTPFVAGARYAFAGASADGEEAVFESRSAQLGTTPPGVEGRSNVYAWDAATQTLSLVSRMNGEGQAGEEEDAEKLPAGAFAGPYDWANANTGLGGARALYYTHDTHAVAEDGSVFFTAAGTGHLYERLNPTRPQSAMSGEECIEPAKACTIDVSASQRSTADTGGPQPAAFQLASPDGDIALFTSSQKLTNDANTGPEVPPPTIGRLTLNGEEKAEEELDNYFEGAHGVGIAIDENESHIYWIDPNKGTIARATLNPTGPPSEVEKDFVDVAAEETCSETRPYLEPGQEQCGHSIPRYVALGPCAGGAGECVYWTNAGPLAGELNHTPTELPVRGAGTIGRAKLDGSSDLVPGSIEPAFIEGASDPQGIAVNESHIYWANSSQGTNNDRWSIGRATLEDTEVDQGYVEANLPPYGLALSPTRLYYAVETNFQPFSGLHSILLGGGGEEQFVTGESVETRGVALAGTYIYWTDQATGAIGRVRLPLEEPSDGTNHLCSEIPRCEGEFLKPGGALFGLAADPAEEHLYWTANGDVPPHPGQDLYRFQRQGSGGCVQAPGCLADLAPLPPRPGEEDGAEVLAVVGSSKDASRVYFVADGVLSEAPNAAGEVAARGTCDRGFGGGRCNLYLSEGGDISFIAPLNAGGETKGDTWDWRPAIALGRQKTAFASADGKTLLFESQERLTPLDNEGVSELYLYRLGQGITCVSCVPTGAPPAGEATLGTIHYPLITLTDTTALASRNLSADGRRAFFESPDPLVATDTNGAASCPQVGAPSNKSPACRDVYEWEAPVATPSEGDSCTASSPSYSPSNQGCLYLISSGESNGPSFFADASESGSDVFFFTRSQLVGQDEDQLLDVYDARVGGGIAAQSPTQKSIPCEDDACKPGATTPPTAASPATPTFQGPGNVTEKPHRPRCPKGRVRRHGRCVKKHGGHKKKQRHNHQVRRNRGGRR
ncbi:MAG TPA: hypothetical protein VFS64_10060 [Solirubrobacterales bacterium]|nr:hypothetical protein [Solirubrobacterales bacterium]